MKKKRKLRGTKLNGLKSKDFCKGYIAFSGDPHAMSQKFRQKIEKRTEKSLCPSCGQKSCRCKSKLEDLDELE